MKFDIYRGTEKDMKESGGELQLTKCNKYHVKEFCKRHEIDYTTFINGDYIHKICTGFWLEEAM